MSTAAQVAPAAFMLCLAHTETGRPAVRWNSRATRSLDTLVLNFGCGPQPLTSSSFHGHRIRTRSVKPLTLPDDVVVIEHASPVRE